MFQIGKQRRPAEQLIPVPPELPPLEGLDEEDRERRRRQRRASRLALLVALAAVLLLAFVIALGALGIYSGLRDRALANHQMAQEHYSLGLKYLEAGRYELAVAEFELAMRREPDLPGLSAQLLRAKQLAEPQVTPTSETRRDAATALYRQAVNDYENGNLEQAIEALTELQGLDAEYQRKNVETMLVMAHYQLGLNAVREDRLDDASAHFQSVLQLNADPAVEQSVQEEINLLELYRAALSHWGQDWAAAIQALKGLYALAPGYKDVQTRLHDAYSLRAQEYVAQGDWCLAAEEYAAAAQIFPLEETVDKRDDAAIQCQTTPQRPAIAPTATPAGAAASPSPGPQATKKPSAGASVGTGRIVYPRYDAYWQRHDLYIVDLPKATPRLFRENATQPAFDPGRTRVAYRDENPSGLGLDILDLNSGNSSELTAHPEDGAPTWSANADQIAFASNKHGDRKWRIYIISTGEVRGEGQERTYGQMPAWAPDGSEIAYRGCDLYGNNCALWLMEPGGFNQTRLTTDPSDTSPSWRPDGLEIAFVSSRTGNWELYAVDVTTGKERRLTNHAAADVAPAWSPDGKRLAFLSNREGAWAVYVLDVRSGRVQKVVATGDPYPDPVSQRLAWIP